MASCWLYKTELSNNDTIDIICVLYTNNMAEWIIDLTAKGLRNFALKKHNRGIIEECIIEVEEVYL